MSRTEAFTDGQQWNGHSSYTPRPCPSCDVVIKDPDDEHGQLSLVRHHLSEHGKPLPLPPRKSKS